MGKGIYEYYFLLRNFLAHNPNYMRRQAGQVNKRFIIEKYTEGLSYREIAKESKKLAKPFSYYVAFMVVNEFLPVALAWNKTHPQGHENCNSDMDFFLDDIPLKDYDEGEE